ncbi:MAG: hypothetical protein JNN04_07415 [Cyclobacteriaceae bacterium]|nr:hypothetical protein [Cyclobacteriaceae bacterium]
MKKADFFRVPVNLEGIPWRVFRLYVKYLDLKVQNPDAGTFKIYHSKRSYQKAIKEMISKGWLFDRGRGEVKLRAYPAVWRLMGIQRFRVKGVLKYRYWKIPLDGFSDDRPTYLREIEKEIRKRMAVRKGAQIRRALQIKGTNNDRATFAGMSVALLFGYQSPSTGSKLRKSFFEVLPQTEEEAKPYFNRVNGRYENRTKQIAL